MAKGRIIRKMRKSFKESSKLVLDSREESPRGFGIGERTGIRGIGKYW
jgi:hypothetical protein